MAKSKYILRAYRITPAEDRLVKASAKKFGGESAFIRILINATQVHSGGNLYLRVKPSGKKYFGNGVTFSSSKPTPQGERGV